MAEKSSKTIDNSNILRIAANIVDAGDQEVVQLLLELQQKLNDAPSNAAQKLRHDAFELGLLDVCFSTLLNSDYKEVDGKWNSVAKIVELVCDICSVLQPDQDQDQANQFEQAVLYAAEVLLKVANIVHKDVHQSKTQSMEIRIEVTRAFRIVLDGMIWLVSAHSWLALFVLQAKSYIALLMSGENDTASTIISIITNFISIRPGICKELQEDDINNIMDELIYKLTTTNEIVIASTITRLLLTIIEDNSNISLTLYERYKGLKQLVNRWIGRGFDNALKQFIYILDSGSAKSAHEYRINHAATIIQSAFKGYKERKKLKSAQQAMTKLQQKIRKRVQDKIAKRIQDKEVEVAKRERDIRKRKDMLKSKERQLQALNAIPAAKMAEYFTKSEILAATKIQSVWRGLVARRKFKIESENLRQWRAARTIQRCARKFLDRLRSRKLQAAAKESLMPPGLDDQRRTELMTVVEKFKKQHSEVERSQEEIEEMLYDIEDILTHYWSFLPNWRRKQYEMDALVARIETETELLNEAPSLSEVQPEDLEKFTCYSQPIVRKAQEEVQADLKALEEPWWKHLGGDSDSDDDDLFPEFPKLRN
ncbi:IQ calmodulin-binding motif-containing protein 1 [Trichoplax sp. H2]|nr:IQ calmodulin-binding motif-containing protein 1 [Trichoplax sp. H2]|eukprot:RDD45266.1 IQ calmodulin-binding motif-containing protein 1 [Trichoplax sp. H2]